MQSLVFQRLCDRDRLLAFRPDGSYIFWDNLPFVAYEPVPRREKNSLRFYLLVAVLVLFLSALIGWLLSSLVARLRGSAESSAATRRACSLAVLFSVCNIVIVVGLVGLFFKSPPWSMLFVMGELPNWPLLGWFTLGVASALMSAGLVYFTVQAWRGSYWSLPGRLHYALVALAALGFVFFLNTWNLLGFHL
jgi:hypothetical protein